jgi:CheY-like chemotaxis protein
MSPRKILVADEDTDTRIILRALLERHGYAVIEAASAQQAMAAVGEEIGVVIMNHPMMATPQITLARWMRAQPETRETPIINLTSRAVPNFIEEAAKQGVTVSLVKPLDVHAMLELVRQLSTPVAVAQ